MGFPACTPLRSGSEVVAAWRTSGDSSLLWMSGTTSAYRFDPLGEYVIGVAGGTGYRLRRAGVTWRVCPGDVVVLDPSSRHEGTTNDGSTWPARLLVMELSRLNADLDTRVDLEVDIPVFHDLALTRRFLDVHRLSSDGRPSLELEVVLQQLIAEVAQRMGSTKRRQEHDGSLDDGVRIALDRINSDPVRAIALGELAELSEMSRYALVRRFKAAIGLPPHTYQIALRLQLARRLIEHGERPAHAAVQAGFTDQSHLHRHFRKGGMTPGAYAAAIERGRSTTRRRS
jgi:AraC-like DNA-binding protein